MMGPPASPGLPSSPDDRPRQTMPVMPNIPGVVWCGSYWEGDRREAGPHLCGDGVRHDSGNS